MQEQTIRNLTRAQKLINDYREQQIELRYLVDSLEGTVRSLEERLPEVFYATWEKSWSQLEIALALGKESLYSNEIERELKNLEALLSEALNQQKDEPAS